MSNELATGHELEAANEIYDRLQEYRGRAILTGFVNGEIIFEGETPRRIEVSRLPVTIQFERDLMLSRGFTEEDMDSGILVIIEKEFLNPDWPMGKFTPEPTLAYYNVSATGKIVRLDEEKDQFVPAELNQMHRDAISAIFELSKIPFDVIENFGSYEAFRKLFVHGKDFRGIDTAEMTKTQILYNGGLRAFVQGLELRKSNQLEKMDTALHQLRESLDPRGHFFVVFQNLANAGIPTPKGEEDAKRLN